MPTYADVYCAGFISRQTLPDANFVAGGLQTPADKRTSRHPLNKPKPKKRAAKKPAAKKKGAAKK